MLRDVSTVSSRDPVSSLTLAPANHMGLVELFDPYSQQMDAHGRAGSVVTVVPGFSSVPHGDAAGGASKALRLLQLALLASVAVMVWYMLSLL